MNSFCTFGLALFILPAFSQGTLIYDQQSATNGLATGGSPIQSLQPMGQSFTPSLATVGFVQLQFSDGAPANSTGAFVYVNLLDNSITGNVIAASSPVFLRDSFFGTTNFFFPANIPVTPGIAYYFQPVLQSGEPSFTVLSDHYSYAGGAAFFLGQPDPGGKDFWFREGVAVPEPATSALLVSGVLAVWLARNRRG